MVPQTWWPGLNPQSLCRSGRRDTKSQNSPVTPHTHGHADHSQPLMLPEFSIQRHRTQVLKLILFTWSRMFHHLLAVSFQLFLPQGFTFTELQNHKLFRIINISKKKKRVKDPTCYHHSEGMKSYSPPSHTV